MDIRIVHRDRAITVVHPEWTIKTYRQPEMAQREIDFLARYPWAAPEVLHSDRETGTIVSRTYRVYSDMPDQQDPLGLFCLLKRLESAGCHHRDVHPGNIAQGPHGPLLIDWEVALDETDGLPPIFCSYDLYGPTRSQIAPPLIHRGGAGGGPMWWMADHPSSVMSRWRVSVNEAERSLLA